MDVIDGSYTVRHADWLHLNDAGIKTRLEAAMPSIGRVEVPGHPWAPYGGTAFVVGPGLLMTNRHVAELFASGLGLAGLQFIPGRGAGVDFVRERNAQQHAPITVTGLRMIHPYWDLALLEIGDLPAGHAPLTLETEEIEVGRDHVVLPRDQQHETEAQRDDESDDPEDDGLGGALPRHDGIVGVPPGRSLVRRDRATYIPGMDPPDASWPTPSPRYEQVSADTRASRVLRTS